MGGSGYGRKAKARKTFFLEKKKQKTFGLLVVVGGQWLDTALEIVWPCCT
jgi:hypothetical protein